MCTIRCSVLVPANLADTSATTKFGHAQLYPRLLPPFHSNANASAATHSSPNLGIHAQPCPYPLSPFQSSSNTSHLWLTVSASHAWTRVGMPCRSAHHSFWLPRYSSILHQFNLKIYTSPLPNPTIPFLTFSTTMYKACNFISVFSGSSIILFKCFCKFSSIFNARQKFGIEK